MSSTCDSVGKRIVFCAVYPLRSSGQILLPQCLMYSFRLSLNEPDSDDSPAPSDDLIIFWR